MKAINILGISLSGSAILIAAAGLTLSIIGLVKSMN